MEPLTFAEYAAFHRRLVALGQDDATATARARAHFADRLAADAQRPRVRPRVNVSVNLTLDGKAIAKNITDRRRRDES